MERGVPMFLPSLASVFNNGWPRDLARPLNSLWDWVYARPAPFLTPLAGARVRMTRRYVHLTGQANEPDGT